jgi:hypothetical protein
MRKYTARCGLVLIFTAVLVCLSSRPVRGTTVDIAPSSTESKPVSTEQLGTGVFSQVPFKVSLSLRTGYDDNVSTSNANGKQGSGYTNGSVVATYDFGSPRTRLSLEVNLGGTYYWDTIRSVGGVDTNNYDINNSLSLSLAHKATPRLTLSAVAYLTYKSEPDFTIAQGINRRGGNYFFTEDRFSVAYLWTPRLSTSTDYSVSALNYDDSAIGQFEDRFENTFGNQFRFLIWPTTTMVGEYRLQIASYIHESTRDSIMHFALVGFDHSFDPRFNISLRGGAQFVNYDQGGSQSSPYFEGLLSYVLGKQTSVSWTNRYSIEQADVAANQGRKTFRTGLTAKHDFTPRVTGSLSAYYSNDEYQGTNSPAGIGSGFTEDSFNMAISLRYKVTRYFGVEAGYNYTDVSSDIPLREYSRNSYWGGLNVSF